MSHYRTTMPAKVEEPMMEAELRAASVGCPRCGAKPLFECRSASDRGGNWRANTHIARFKAAGIDKPTYDDKREAIADFEYAKVQRHREASRNTPYERGYRAYQSDEPTPGFPKGDASWEQRLFHRGWCDAKAAALKEPTS